MIAAVAAWWRSRTARERLLLGVAGAVIGVILLPLLGFRAASDFRAGAAAELEAARRLEQDVAALSARSGGSQGVAGDGTLQGLAVANAGALSLQPASTETTGTGALRISFQPARSIDVYRWMSVMTNRGAFITQTTIVREGEADLVRASFVLSDTPS